MYARFARLGLGRTGVFLGARSRCVYVVGAELGRGARCARSGTGSRRLFAVFPGTGRFVRRKTRQVYPPHAGIPLVGRSRAGSFHRVGDGYLESSRWRQRSLYPLGGSRRRRPGLRVRCGYRRRDGSAEAEFPLPRFLACVRDSDRIWYGHRDGSVEAEFPLPRCLACPGKDRSVVEISRQWQSSLYRFFGSGRVWTGRDKVLSL